LPIHYATFMRLNGSLMAVYLWKYHTGGIWSKNFSPVFGQFFTFFVIFHVLNIHFGPCNPKKEHPCVRPRRLSHCA